MSNQIIIKTRSKFHTFEIAKTIAHSAYMEDWDYRITKSDFIIIIETEHRDMDDWLMDEFRDHVC